MNYLKYEKLNSIYKVKAPIFDTASKADTFTLVPKMKLLFRHAFFANI